MTLLDGCPPADLSGLGSWFAMRGDPYNLERFRAAQDRDGTYAAALDELRRGRKQSHWMWFVLPQLAGLGRSPTAQRFAISGADEARAYLADPVLGPRLRECADALLALDAHDPEAVLGPIDALKLHSSMTLFGQVAPEEPSFAQVLARWFAGQPDPRTVQLLGGATASARTPRASAPASGAGRRAADTGPPRR